MAPTSLSPLQARQLFDKYVNKGTQKRLSTPERMCIGEPE
jgi:hypothetical protein